MRRSLSTAVATSVLSSVLTLANFPSAAASRPAQESSGGHTNAERTTSPRASEKTVVKVWLADYPFPGYLKQRLALARKFNEKYPNVDVRVRAVPYAKLPGKFAQALSDGNAPAVANFYYSASAVAHDMRDSSGKRAFQPVEAAIAGRAHILDEPVVTGDLLPILDAQYRVDGELIAQPVTTQTTLLLGNRALLKRAGVSKMPRTWQQLRQTCRRVVNKTDLTECVAWPNHNWFFQQAAAQQGRALFNRANGRRGSADRVRFASDGVLKFARWWRSMAAEGLYRYSGMPEDWGASFNKFASQEAAFVLDTSNQQGTYESMGITTTAAPLPLPSRKARPANMNSGDALWLLRGMSQAEQDAALAFMQFISSPRAMAKWHRATGYLPVTQSSVDLLRDAGELPPGAAATVALRRMRQASRAPHQLTAWVGAFDLTHNELLEAMHAVLVDGSHIRSRLQKADRRAQRLLNRYRTSCRTGNGPEHCYYIGPWG